MSKFARELHRWKYIAGVEKIPFLIPEPSYQDLLSDKIEKINENVDLIGQFLLIAKEEGRGNSAVGRLAELNEEARKISKVFNGAMELSPIETLVNEIEYEIGNLLETSYEVFNSTDASYY